MGEILQMWDPEGICCKAPGKEEVVAAELLVVSHGHHGTATILALLKACAKHKNLHRGTRIHADIIRMGLLERNIYVGNTLVNMYAKCGALATAQEVFDTLPARNVATWNALIGGYAHHGHGDEALICFEQMQSKGVSPDTITFLSTLKACGSVGSANKGREVHDKIVKDGFLVTEVVIGTALADMYAKCGLLEKAQEAFDEVQVRNVISWNALIAGYAQHGCGKEALSCFERMHCEGLSPDAVTFTCSLKACGSIGAMHKGQEIHAKIGSTDLMGKDIVLANALIDMYAKNGWLAKAHKVFDKLLVQDIVSWNVLIAGYAQYGCGEEALNCFEQMKLAGFSPDTVTFACILKACGIVGDAEKGEEIHAEFAGEGWLKNDVVVANALVDMYGKCGMLEKALEVFYKLPVRNVVSWNALISSYAQHGCGEKALDCLKWMQSEDIAPSAITFLCILKACSIIGDTAKCLESHAHIIIDGLTEKDVLVGTALVEMYASSGMLAEAQDVFDKLAVQDVISWNALMAGYAHYAHNEEALNCFEWMQHQGHSPNLATFVCILKVCGTIGTVYKGQEIHAEIARGGLLRDLVVGTALVDMYANCGMLVGAKEVFDKLPVRDVVLWNAVITGYARMGNQEMVFELFDKMIVEGQQPNVATLTSLLNTCSHTGLLNTGLMLFVTMSPQYGIILNVEHHTCMIDLFGRAGQLDKAVAMLKEMPLPVDLTAWHTVLGACQKSRNMKIGRLAFKHAEQLDETDVAAYVYMRNIYAAGRQDDSDRIEAAVGELGWRL